MDFEIKEKKENNLLERTEVDAIVSFDGATPQTQQIRELIVQKLGCNPDLMVIRKTEPRFGETKISVIVHIYKTPERMKKIEEEFVLKRNKLAEEKKEEPKAEEKPKEGKAEEKKEEPKEEPKAKEEPKEKVPKEEPKAEEKPKEKPPEEEPKAEEKPKEEKAEEKKEEK